MTPYSSFIRFVQDKFLPVFAFVSTAGFCMLVSAAIFYGYYYNRYVTIPVAIPSSVSSLYAKGMDRSEVDCMAQNIFFEARGESAKGKMMVGMVVIERTRSPHYPASVCGVVNQANTDLVGRLIKGGCQFSWVCDGKDHSIDLANPAVRHEWVESLSVAELVMSGKLKPKIDMEGVTHYHADYVKPFWSKSKNYKVVAKVGEHIFYRWSKATLPKLTIASI